MLRNYRNIMVMVAIHKNCSGSRSKINDIDVGTRNIVGFMKLVAFLVVFMFIMYIIDIVYKKLHAGYD